MCSNAFKVACSSPGELEGPLLNSSRRPALKPVALAGVAGEDERLLAQQWCFENLPPPPTTTTTTLLRLLGGAAAGGGDWRRVLMTEIL